MKLYKNISRFHVRRNIPKSVERRLKWALSLEVGDLINDCTGFNVVVRSLEALISHGPRIYLSKKPDHGNGWYIYDVDFNTELGGGCSLRHCGVQPPLPRDVLERDWLKGCAEYDPSNTGLGGAIYWFGGTDRKQYQESLARYRKRVDILNQGGHFTDERGCFLSIDDFY